MMTFSNGTMIQDTPMTYSKTKWEGLTPPATKEESPKSLKIIGILGTIALLALLATGTTIYFLQKRRREQQGRDQPGHSEDPEAMDHMPMTTPTNLEDPQAAPQQNTGHSTEPAGSTDTELENPPASEPESTQPQAFQ
jgi:heme/copper-type cytochrome/quinol oxidase subunit 2